MERAAGWSDQSLLNCCSQETCTLLVFCVLSTVWALQRRVTKIDEGLCAGGGDGQSNQHICWLSDIAVSGKK